LQLKARVQKAKAWDFRDTGWIPPLQGLWDTAARISAASPLSLFAKNKWTPFLQHVGFFLKFTYTRTLKG